MKHVYFLYSSYFSNSNNVWRKPIKHERNVHNIKRHRSSINRGSRVSKGARCRSIDKGGGRREREGEAHSRNLALNGVPVRGSTWIRGTWDPTVAILPHLVTIQSTMLHPLSILLPSPPLALFPSRLFSTNFSLFHPSSLLFFAISIFVRISLLLSLLMKKKKNKVFTDDNFISRAYNNNFSM